MIVTIRSLHDDGFVEPLVVFRDSRNLGLPDILHVIQAAGLHFVPDVCVVHLNFETLLWEAGFLKLCMKINSAV